MPKMATFRPPGAEKLIFSDKTLPCWIDCAPKRIQRILAFLLSPKTFGKGYKVRKLEGQKVSDDNGDADGDGYFKDGNNLFLCEVNSFRYGFLNENFREPLRVKTILQNYFLSEKLAKYMKHFKSKYLSFGQNSEILGQIKTALTKYFK